MARGYYLQNPKTCLYKSSGISDIGLNVFRTVPKR